MNQQKQHVSIIFLEKLGSLTLRMLKPISTFILQSGAMTLLFLRSMKTVFDPPIRFKLMMDQIQFIGVGSLFIVILTALFTGMVFALQSGRAFAIFGAQTLTGAVVTITLSRELAPVLTALMVTARAGSAMAAQIGTMKVTQQVDALVSMAVSPMNYLVAPRIVASAIVVPLLTSIFNFVGILGSYLVSVYLLNIDQGSFIEKIRFYSEVSDFIQGLFKSIIFGIIMSVICCHYGLNAQRGALDVGEKVTQAVVISSVMILVFDYFLTAILF